jgi:Uma2 family endonuclease
LAYIQGMSEATHPRRMTADEFIAWAMEQPRGRFELAGGEVVAMAPERSIHARVKFRFARRLEEEVERLGLDCTVYSDGMAVQIDEDTVYEPDALLRCGPDLLDEQVKLHDPTIVVEVVSRSTRALDTGQKLFDYFRLASTRHYLVVLAEQQTIFHHERRPEGEISTRLIRDGGPVALDPPGIVLRDLFPVRRS